jgi:hypothetical protein
LKIGVTAVRTLREEIAYQRENGFLHNTIEHSTLLAWLGEQAANEDEIRLLREQNQKLRFAREDLLNAIDQKQKEIDKLAELLTPNA